MPVREMGRCRENEAVFFSLFVWLFSSVSLKFYCVAEVSCKDFRALPEKFLFVDSCLIVGFC